MAQFGSALTLGVSWSQVQLRSNLTGIFALRKILAGMKPSSNFAQANLLAQSCFSRVFVTIIMFFFRVVAQFGSALTLGVEWSQVQLRSNLTGIFALRKILAGMKPSSNFAQANLLAQSCFSHFC